MTLTLLHLVFAAFAAFGFAFVVGHAEITDPIRSALWDTNLRPLRFAVRLLECPGCISFWVGALYLLSCGADVVCALLFGLFLTGTSMYLSLRAGLVARGPAKD
jgi:hypothetical protein